MLLSSLLFATLFSFNLFSVEAKSLVSDFESMSKENKTTYPAPVISDDGRGPFISSNAGVGFLIDRSSSNLKSAVFEAIFGYNLNNIVKLGASYQYQVPIHVRSHYHQFDYNLGISQLRELKYNVQLQSLALKAYLSPEFPVNLKSLTLSPFLSFGLGIGYLEMGGDNAEDATKVKDQFALKTVWSVNPLFIAEGGLTFGTKLISATTGCRLGRYQTPLSGFRGGFFSVTPYAGLQLNF